MKSQKYIYWASTGLFTVMMLFSAGMYIFNHAEIVQAFEKLGHPSYIVYPLAIAKLLGLVAIWTKLSKTLTEWAYAGFFFNAVLAFFAHYMIGDGEFAPALVAIILVLTSYYFYKKLNG
ncbi:MAG: DoxX family protein [Saprospiraceae bacterium]